MGRRRIRHHNLPKRVYVHRRWYRFVPKNGKPIKLAPIDDYSGMLRSLSDLLEDRPSIVTMSDLMDRYQLEVLPLKKKKLREDQTRQLKNLRRTFGEMPPTDLRQSHAHEYLSRRGATAPTAANREIELLSHICSMGVRWDAMLANPLRDMKKITIPPRDRYVTDEEFEHVRSLASPMVQCVMDLAVLTGLRRGDILGLRKSDYTEAGLYAAPSKTRGSSRIRLLFELTDELVAVLERAIALPPRNREYIVGNRKGNQFTNNGFDSVWQRLMSKATDPNSENPIERFQFRDLRRKSATDEEDETVAQRRLGHTSVEITNRVYRVKPRRVKPLR